ncbi:zinc finger CCHC domain-containing protein 7-like [Mastacembelus armatus]|uniref:Zinc finger CCHC domain-containing protein 7 n=1 Tax=Mastacembelus armatus TaxID=205130 RepID=A0A7N9APG6_9TELE|nr:zinc finger CCHC domain-containing protein 7-like [Mastacembelus armatus]
MDYTKEIQDVDNEEAGSKDELFFIEDSCSSGGEGLMELGRQKGHSSCNRASQLCRESSPPLLLAFSITSGSGLPGGSPSPASSSALQEEEEESDHAIEEWMILGGEEQVGDSSIQLNLGYWSSSDQASGDEDTSEKSVKDAWAVSEKDKSLFSRYFVPDRSLICNICNRMGHLDRSCYYRKKYPTCILCGMQGHIQRDCPGRPCISCGLPSHGYRSCDMPPVWNQHCERCGITGHLSDGCPDTWRQYHLTIQLEVPIRPQTVHTLKHKRCHIHCYNCSKRGHYGYKCTKRRMSSGTFPSLPYVCHYDTMEDIFQRHNSMQKRAKELLRTGSLSSSDQQHFSEPIGESGEENQPVQGRSRTKQEACSPVGRRKTWPERRIERREVKRLKREAQARRGGGLLGKYQGNSDDEICPADPFRRTLHSHRVSTQSPQKKRKDEAGGRRSRKSKEAERWKKRGGPKRGDLYPHGNIDIGSENLLSPKQRVRHRRR